ncbi:hypothetical protein I553_3625, partial [Mycobacterium xenopi 4042]
GRQRAGERTELTDLLDGVHRGCVTCRASSPPPTLAARAMHRCPASPRRMAP